MFLVWFVILKCSENLCCISTAFDDFLSFCLLCSFQGTTLRELCSLKTRQCRTKMPRLRLRNEVRLSLREIELSDSLTFARRLRSFKRGSLLTLERR